MVTPLLSDFTLDVKGVNQIVEHLVKGGVHGVFILGTTGESSSLSYREKEKLIEETCKAVQGRIPVLVGITDTSLTESINLGRVAAGAGAMAVVAAPPFYFNIGQEELLNYFHQLADQSPLPLFLYNMPSHTKMYIEPKTVLELAGHPNIIGIKDSSANAAYFQSLCHRLRSQPEFSLLTGPEELMAESVLMGGHGGVNGGANLFPELYVELYAAANERDFSKIHSLQKRVMEITSKIYTVGRYSSGYLIGLKTAMSMIGLCEEHVLPPLISFEKKEKSQIAEGLKQIMAESV